MVTLLCFCCEHRNPAGARFCNACGTPLHLKPCKRCETINERAAAHCHRCGETFALEFVTLDEAARLPEPETPMPAAEPRVAAEPVGTPARRVRMVLMVAGVALAATAATWFNLRLGPSSQQTVEASGLAADNGRNVQAAGGEAPPVRAEAVLDDGTSARAEAADRVDEREASPAGEVADVREDDRVEREAQAAGASTRPAVGAMQSPARAVRADGRATQRPPGARNETGAAPAASQSSGTSMVMAVQRPAAVVPRRRQVDRSTSSDAGRGVVRVEPGTPCAEGYAPAPGCDFRAMPKGN